MNAVTACRVLVADDTATDRLILQTLLKKLGHQVVCAVDGVDAVNTFQQQDFDLVLMDALMPNMDGFEAARLIKQAAGESFIPIIFLTSLQDADSLARCLDAGGDDFLSKPYNNIILQAKINAFVRMQSMHILVAKQRDEIAEHNWRLLREQEVAKKIFDKVAHSGCLHSANIKHAVSPLAIFNGDVVFAAQNPAGNHLLLVGDFTGHGLDAALGAMPLAQTFYSMIEKGFGRSDIIAELNRKLYEMLPTGMFCCACLAEVDYANSTLHLWNGGLPPGLIYRHPDGVVARLESKHLPLGIVSANDFDAGFDIFDIELEDRIYIWSDGLVETQNAQGEMFGERRLLEVFEQATSVQRLFTDLNVAVNSFIAGNQASDDISLVEVTVVEAAAAEQNASTHYAGDSQGPDDWALHYQMRPASLRQYNPLPMLLNILLQVPGLKPYGSQLYTVLTELYNNALEHGILRLQSAIKDSAEGFCRYYEQREQALSELQTGQLDIYLSYQGDALGGQLEIRLQDSGEGFGDRDSYQSDLLAKNYSGRGIQLVEAICRSVHYISPGNQVVATFSWGEWP